MDRSAAKAIVDAELGPLLFALGIPHWKVAVSYGPAAGGADRGGGFRCPGEVSIREEYERANVTIDPDQVDDPGHLRAILRHELFHVVVSPFRTYREDRLAAIPSGSSDDERETRLWRFCDERAVLALERLWQGMLEHVRPTEAGPEEGS